MTENQHIFEKKNLSAGDAAREFGVTRAYITKLAREGKISAHRVDTHWYVDAESLENFFHVQSSELERRRLERSAAYAREYAAATASSPSVVPAEVEARGVRAHLAEKIHTVVAPRVVFALVALALFANLAGLATATYGTYVTGDVTPATVIEAASQPALALSSFTAGLEDSARTVYGTLCPYVPFYHCNETSPEVIVVETPPTTRVVTTPPAERVVVREPVQTTVINNPVVERTVQTERVVTESGISEDELVTRLQELSNRLTNQILQLSLNSSPLTAPVSVPQITAIGHATRIDTLSGVDITNSTFNNGSLDNVTITNANISADSLSFSGVWGISNGGTGTSTAPNYGQLLVGDGAGGYTLLATSSLGIGVGISSPGGANGSLQYNDSGLFNGANVYFDEVNGRLGIGTTSPYAMLSVAGETVAQVFTATSTTATSTLPNVLATNLRVSGILYDGNNSAGANGYVLQSTGTGFQWVATSTLGFAASGGTTDLNWEINAAGYLAPTTTRTTLLNGGFVSQASSTIAGNLTVTGGTVLGNATATNATTTNLGTTNLTATNGTSTNFNATTFSATNATLTNLVVSGTATSTFGGGIQSPALNITSSTASSTFANGINLSGGCFAVNGTCITGGSGSGTVNTGAANALAFYPSGGTTVDDVDFLFVDDTTNRLGIGTSSPYAMLAVAGEVVGQYFTATSTTATSTLPNLALSRLLFGSDYLTDITGSGLQITNSALTLDRTGDWTGTFDGQEGSYYLANSFATTSADYWKSVSSFFATTSAEFWVNGSTTIPKTYTNNTFTGGNIFGNTTTTNATTSRFAITGVVSALLKTNADGTVVPAVLGTDYSNFAYLFPSNATSTTLTFSGGLLSTASSTVGGGTQATGLTVSGGATTTGNLVVQGTGTSTFAGGIQGTALNITSTTASSTFANGINLSAGCFAVNGVCVGSGSGTVDGTGAAGRVTYWSDADTLTSSASFLFDAALARLTVTNLVATDATTTNATTTNLAVSGDFWLNGERFTDLTGTGLQNSAGVLTLNATGDWTGTFDGQEGSYYLANSFATTSADYWKSVNNFFSTTSADYFLAQNQGASFSTTSATHFVHSSTTIPKTYTNNTFTGTNMFSALATFAQGLISQASSTIAGDFTVSGNTSLAQATSSSFAITGITSSLLKTNANGSVVPAVAGTDYANFAYLFPSNATSTLLSFNGGLIAASSSFTGTTTIGNYAQNALLTIAGPNSSAAGATLSFSENSTSGNGINLVWDSTDNQLEFFDDSANTNRMILLRDSGNLNLVSGALLVDGTGNSRIAGNLGIGTTSPYAKLSVVGEVVASHFTATTTATSTFPTLSVTGRLYDGAGTSGTNGQILQTSGTGVTWVATSTLGLGSINAIGAAGQTSDGPTVTFATSSDTNIGLTITGSGDTQTFTSTWTGTLADARVANDITVDGGTINNTPIGAGGASTGAFTTLSTSGLATLTGFLSSASSTVNGAFTATGNVTLGHATSTSLYSTTIGLNSEYFTDLTGTGLQNTGGVLTLNATGDWTGTFDGQEGSYYLANSFSTTSAEFWVNGSTTIPKTYTNNTFTGTNAFNGATTYNALATFAQGLISQASSTFSGNLTVVGGSIFGNSTTTNATSTNSYVSGTLSLGSALAQTYGGTGIASYTAGDVLYANGSGNLTALPVGSPGQVLKVSGSNLPSWGSDLTTGGGGAGAWATTTGDLAIYPADTSDVVIIGNSATTATGYILEVDGSTLVDRGTFVVDAANNRVGVGTTSPYAKLSVAGEVVGQYFTATSTTATSTLPNVALSRLLFGSDYLTDITGAGLQISGNALTLDATGDWTGTFDGQEGSYYLANGFSTTSADFWAHGSTTMPKTYTSNTFSGLQTFSAGLLSSASSTIGAGGQGTGLTIFGGATTTGNAVISGSLSLGTALSVSSGGTGASTFGQGWLYSPGGTNALAASTSPTVNYITATSTTATSSFAYGLQVLSGQVLVPDGVAALPGLAFAGSPNTGLIQSSNIIQLVTSGTTRWSVSSSFSAANSSGPSLVNAAGTVSAPNVVPNRADTSTGLSVPTAGNLVSVVSGAEAMRVTSTGVGIGTTSPYAKLSVVGEVVASHVTATTTATSTFPTLSVTGRLYDGAGTSGTNGQILQTSGTGIAWVSTSTLGFLSSAVTAIGPVGQTSDGPTVTFATSSDTNIGLTITGSGDTQTFTSTWTGTLADARVANDITIDGGTINNTPIGAGGASTAAFTTLSTSGLATLSGFLSTASSTVNGTLVVTGNTTLAHATATSLYATTLGLNSEYFTDLTGAGLQNSGGVLTLNATGDWTGTFDGQEGSYYLANSFSTTSAQYFVHSSTTIPKTYTNNTFTGTNAFNGATTYNALATFAQGLISQASSTFSGTLTAAGNTTLTNATTTNFAITGVVSSLLKTNADGTIVPAVLGTDYQNFAYLFPSNATSTLLNFNGGLTSYASTTIGAGGQGTGLTISGGATTTGNALIQGTLAAGTSTLTNVTVTNTSTSTIPTLSVTGRLYDGAGTAGTNGQILQTSGTGVAWVATSTLGLGTINAIGAAGQTSDGPTVTFATTSDTNIGLTITGSGDTQTFTSTWTGTLADARVANDITVDGGTINNTPIGAGGASTGAFTTLSTSGLATLTGFLSSASSTVNGAFTATGNVTLGHSTSTSLYATTIGLNSEYFTDLTGTGLQNTGGVLTLNATGDWTGTFDGQEGSYYLANSFSTTSAQYFVHSSTTIPKTYTTNTFSALQTFAQGLISQASSTFSGALTVVGTATLGDATMTNATSTTFQTGTLGVGSDYITDITGTGLTNVGGALTVTSLTNASFANMVAGFDASGNLTSTSSPQVAAIFATSTNATSTFAGGITGPNSFTVQSTSGWLGVGTTTPSAALGVAGNAYIAGNINLDALSALKFAGTTVLSATSTTFNTLVGLLAGQSIVSTSTDATSGIRNTALGYQALQNATSTDDNIAIGYRALMGTSTAGFSGSQNIGIGNFVMASTTSGSSNTALGHGALTALTTGSQNAVFGVGTGARITTGARNVLLGFNAGDDITGGNDIVAIGDSAGEIAALPSGSVVIGSGAIGSSGNMNSSSGGLTVIGFEAGDGITGDTSRVTLVGYQAGRDIESAEGDDTTLLGYQSGFRITSGSGNIGIGASSTANITSGSDNIMIGNRTYGPASNTSDFLNIGSLLFGTLPQTSSSFRLPTSGAIGIGTSSPFAKLSIHSNNGDTATTLFAIASSTASATTTHFSVSNTGLTTLTNLWATASSTLQDVTALNATSTALYTGLLGINNEYISDLTGSGLAISSGALTVSTSSFSGAGSLFNADFLDSLDSTQFLRSDVADQADGLLTFTQGFLSTASSTVGAGGQGTGLTISGGATTTGNLIVQGTGTSTFAAGIQSTALNITSTTASSTFANGIDLSGGCFAIGGICLSPPTIDGAGGTNRLAFWSDANSLSSNSGFTYDGSILTVNTPINISDTNQSYRIGNTPVVFASSTIELTALGFGAADAVTSGGSNNTGVGSNALTTTTTGDDNTAVGQRALFANDTGSGNTAVGTRALNGSTGSANVALGYRAGDNITSGSNNIMIGYDIDSPGGTTGSNLLNIGNLLFGTAIDGTGTTLSTGNIGIGTTSPYARLSVAGQTVAAYFTATTTATSTFPTLSVTGRLYDGAGTSGTDGQILQTSGTGVTWVATSTLGLGTINAVGAAGQTSDGPTVTFATTSDTNVGLTITGSGDTQTFTSTWTGTLADARVANDITVDGGTINNTPIGAGGASTGAFTTLSTSGLATLTGFLSSASSTVNGTLVVTGNTTLAHATSSSLYATTVGLNSEYFTDFTGTGLTNVGGALTVNGVTNSGYANMVAAFDASGALTATSSPQVAVLFATSSTATSTFAGAVRIATTSVSTAASSTKLFVDLQNMANNSTNIRGMEIYNSTAGLTIDYGPSDGNSTDIGGAFVINHTGSSMSTYAPAINVVTTGTSRAMIGVAGNILASNSTNPVTPGFGFINDPDNGIYAPAANTLGFTSGGTEKARFSSTGNFGIGTTSPYAKLSVEGDAVIGGANGVRATVFTATSTATSSIPTLSVTGRLYDGAGTSGTNGQILQTSGTGMTWVSTSTLGLLSGAVTAIGPVGETSDGPTVTFATSSDTNIGLTITGAGDTQTFTSTWTGTLADARVANDITVDGGTINNTPIGAGGASTAAFTTLSTSGLATLTGFLSSASSTVNGAFTATGNVTLGDATSTSLYATTLGLNSEYFTDLTGTGLSNVGGALTVTGVSNAGYAHMVAGYDASGTLVGTSSPQVATLFATSTTATSTFSGGVAIGSASSNYRLLVSGTGDNVTSGGLEVSNSSGGTNAAASLHLNANGNSGYLNAFGSGYTAIPTLQDRVVLGLDSTASGLTFYASGASQDIRFFTGGTAERARLDTTGNFGIGTTSPYAKLSVAGEAVASHFTATTTATSTFPTLSVTGRLYDGAGTSGTNGQILQTTGTGMTWVSTSTLGLLSSAVTNIGPAGQLADGPTVTFATTSDTNIGLTITGSGDALTFTSTWSGTLADARVADDLTISGGTINNTPIGASTPSTAVFTNSTTTNFAITGITSSLLKTNSDGSVVAAVAGTDYSNFAYLFPSNATSSLLSFSGGIIAASSSFTGTTTVGNYAQNALLTIGGPNTSTAGATLSFSENAASGNGINLVWDSTDNQLEFFDDSANTNRMILVRDSGNLNLVSGVLQVDGTGNSRIAGNLGVGTTSPYAKLSVAGEAVASHFTATTTATSTFPTLSVTGRLYDGAGTSGTNGQILQTSGTGMTWVSTSTLGLLSTAVTAIGPTGQTSDGPTVTFATSSDTNIGLTITGSGDTQTFTSTWAGTLADARVADDLTISGGTISSNNISGTLTTTGTLTIGDGGDRIDINSDSWDVTNGAVSGVTTLTASGLGTFGNLMATASSTLQNFTFVNATGSAATTTSFAISSITSSLLKTNGNGSVVPAVAGTDYANFGYLFPSNATSTRLSFHDGLTSFATTTVGTSTGYSQLTVWATSTAGRILDVVTSASTSALWVSATGNATTTLSGLNISGSATTTSNVGINLSGGCFAKNGVCQGNDNLGNHVATQNIQLGSFSLNSDGDASEGIVINADGFTDVRASDGSASGFHDVLRAYRPLGNTSGVSFGYYANGSSDTGAFIRTTGSNTDLIIAPAFGGSTVERARFTSGGSLVVGTSTAYATTTIWGGSSGRIFEVVTAASSTALSVSATGNATTTLSGLNIAGSATSTSNVGINLSAGCFAINGTCVGGSGGTVDGTGSANALAFWSDSNTLSNNTSFVWDNSATRLGVGTSTPYAKLSIHANNGETSPWLLSIASSTASATTTIFAVSNTGIFNYGLAATTTVVDNNPYAWTIATSSTAAPLFRIDTTAGAELVTLGSTGSDVYIGDVGAASDLVFEESSTIHGQGGNTLTFGLLGDKIAFNVNTGFGTTTAYAPLTAWATTTSGRIFEAVTTASTSALWVSSTGNATTTLSGLNISGSATSTSNVGFNITTGCYAINGVCVGGGGSGDISAVGSMTSGDAFADSSADEDWLGLGASAGRIEFDDLTIDEVNFKDAFVGVGTSSPYARLSVWGSGTTNATIAFEIANNASTTLARVLDDGTSYFLGNLGIGTTSPFRKLSITEAASTAQQAIAYDSARWTDFFTNAVGDFVINPSNDDVFLNDDNLWVCTSGCPASAPTGNGNLVIENKIGVGTSTPGYKVAIETQDSSTNFFQIASTTAQSLFVVNANGRVGIGTSTPSQQLSISDRLFVGAGNPAGMGTATSTFQGDIRITGKLDVSTIDPVYTISGVKYATYGHSTIGIHEETMTTIALDEYDEASGRYSRSIKFDELEEGSDLWLFYQVSQFGEKWEDLVVSLTPAFDGKVFYRKDPATNTLTILSEEQGEVSMRLVADRYDAESWPNLRTDQEDTDYQGHVIEEK